MLEVKIKDTRTTSKHISHLFLVVFCCCCCFFLGGGGGGGGGGGLFEQACLLE